MCQPVSDSSHVLVLSFHSVPHSSDNCGTTVERKREYWREIHTPSGESVLQEKKAVCQRQDYINENHTGKKASKEANLQEGGKRNSLKERKTRRKRIIHRRKRFVTLLLLLQSSNGFFSHFPQQNILAAKKIFLPRRPTVCVDCYDISNLKQECYNEAVAETGLCYHIRTVPATSTHLHHLL